LLKQKGSSKKRIPNRVDVGAIMGLMEEKGRHKDWLLEEIKRHRIKLKVPATATSYDILNNSPREFTKHLYQTLKEDEFFIEDVKTMTKTYHWFFTDIVGSSDPTMSTKAQIRKIWVLIDQIKKSETFKNCEPKDMYILPTGDGMAIGFSDSPEKPLRLAIDLHKALNRYNETRKRKAEKLYVRIGIDTGPVYILKDLAGNENVWGPGIIMTRRVMDLCGENQIFASSRVADHVSNLSSEYKSIMHQVGDYTTKHNEPLVIYNVYDGRAFGNKYASKKGKVIKTKENFQETLKSKTAFVFHGIDVKLFVKDPKTMLTHHIWNWNVINMSDEPRDEIFYYLDGDVPKDFKDMNVKVTDEEGNLLDIKAISVNKPLRKEFNIKMKKPLKPRQRKRYLKLEYDWEEPERNYIYKIPTDCKKFTYEFTIPKGVDIKSRILKIDTELGYKWIAEPPPKISYLPDKTKIKWEASNLKAFDSYKFEW